MAVGSTAYGAASTGAIDSGLVAVGALLQRHGPNSLAATSITRGQPGVDLSGLTPDQQFEAGLTCDGVAATLTSGFTPCDPARIHLEAGADSRPRHRERRPQPAAHRAAQPLRRPLGKNNIFNKEHFKTDLDLTAINVTNKYALYNFLSTFSGTHYVTPRALTAKITAELLNLPLELPLECKLSMAALLRPRPPGIYMARPYRFTVINIALLILPSNRP